VPFPIFYLQGKVINIFPHFLGRIHSRYDRCLAIAYQDGTGSLFRYLAGAYT
jgi:hypothetical protein